MWLCLLLCFASGRKREKQRICGHDFVERKHLQIQIFTHTRCAAQPDRATGQDNFKRKFSMSILDSSIAAQSAFSTLQSCQCGLPLAVGGRSTRRAGTAGNICRRSLSPCSRACCCFKSFSALHAATLALEHASKLCAPAAAAKQTVHSNAISSREHPPVAIQGCGVQGSPSSMSNTDIPWSHCKDALVHACGLNAFPHL